MKDKEGKNIASDIFIKENISKYFNNMAVFFSINWASLFVFITRKLSAEYSHVFFISHIKSIRTCIRLSKRFLYFLLCFLLNFSLFCYYLDNILWSKFMIMMRNYLPPLGLINFSRLIMEITASKLVSHISGKAREVYMWFQTK